MSKRSGESSLSNVATTPVFLHDISKIRNTVDLRMKIEQAGSKLICLCFFNDSEPCRKIASKYQEIKILFKDVVVYVGDVDQCLDVMQAFSLTMVPTFILIQDNVILEVFVGSSYFRLLRRIELRLLEENEDDPRYKDLQRMATIMHDDVYVLNHNIRDPDQKKSTKGVDVLGLHLDTEGPTWKDRTEMFVEACEKVRQSDDFMSFLYEPQSTDVSDTSETNIALNRHMLRMKRQDKEQDKEQDLKARRISFGEHFDLGPLKKLLTKDNMETSSKAQSPSTSMSEAFSPLLKSSDRPLPNLSDTGQSKMSYMDMSIYEDLRKSIIVNELPPTGSDEEVDEEKCAVEPELFGLEDRTYSKEEVEALLNKCMRVCWLHKQNQELPLHQPMPKTIDFGDELEILTSSDDSSD